MLVETKAQFDELRGRLVDLHRRGWSEPVGFDTETFGPNFVHKKRSKPDATRHRLAGYSIAFLDGAKYYVPLRHPEQHTGRFDGSLAQQYEPCAERWKLLGFLAQPNARVWVHNWKFELAVLQNEDIHVGCQLLDSEVAAWMAGWRMKGKGEGAGGLKLKPLAAKHLGHEGPSFDDVAQGRAVNTIPASEIAPYAADDASLTLRLGELAYRRIIDLDAVDHFNLEMRCIPVTEHMERSGVVLDEARLLADAERCEVEAARVAAEFEALTRCEVTVPVKARKPKTCTKCNGRGHVEDFTALGSVSLCQGPDGRKRCVGGILHHKNGKVVLTTVTEDGRAVRGARVGSDADVSRWLFRELGWWPVEADHPVVEYGPSVKEEHIRRFAALPGPAGEACRLRLRYQALRKYASTYTRSLVDLARQSGDGRLHTSYKQDGTDTVRYSSSMPNQSNLPRSKRQALPWMGDLPDIRASFLPTPGWDIVIFDFSQIELRLMAHYSRDAALMAAYIPDANGNTIDLHETTRLSMQANSSMPVNRGDAKITNFCLAPFSRVLTTDFRWVAAADLKPGDAVVGFDECLGRGCRYRNTIVEAVSTTRQKCYRVETTHGSSTVSADHHWVVNGVEPRRGRPVRGWVKTKDLQVGQELPFFARPWDIDNSREAGWLAGILDGEGHIAATGQVSIAQNAGPTLDLIKDVLAGKGFHFSENPTGNGTRCHTLHIRGDGEHYRLLGSIRPGRLLARATLDGRRTVRPHGVNPRITKIVELGVEDVVAVQTGTGTLVSDGFLTHNSTIYKISKWSLARKLAMGTNDWTTYTPDVAQGFIDGFEAAYPKVVRYQERAVRYAEEHDYATSLTGFKRKIDEWDAWGYDKDAGRRFRLRGSCERKAINTPIQASAGGILKRSLVGLYEHWLSGGLLPHCVRIVGQTYDEVIVECSPDVRDVVMADMERIMVSAAPELRVPLAVEGGYGPSWSEAK